MQTQQVSLKIVRNTGRVQVWHGVSYHGYNKDSLVFKIGDDGESKEVPLSLILRAHTVSMTTGKTIDTIPGQANPSEEM